MRLITMPSTGIITSARYGKLRALSAYSSTSIDYSINCVKRVISPVGVLTVVRINLGLITDRIEPDQQ